MSDITIIISAYNRKEYLPTALDSLLHQTFKNFDIVLITNFKYDISKYKPLNIHLIIKDGTIGQYWSEALKHASGSVISFLDDDDYFSDNKLQEIWELFSEPSLIYVHNKSQYFDDKMAFSKIESKIDFNTSSISIRKNALIDYSYLINKITAAQDTFLYSLALKSGGRLINYKKILTYYRKNEDNTSDHGNIKWLLEYKTNLLNFINFFESRDVSRHINKLLILTDFALYSNLGNEYKQKPIKWILFLFYAIYSKELKLLINTFKMLIFNRRGSY